MTRLFQKIFPPKVQYKADSPISQQIAQPVIKKNREVLAEIPDWIDQNAFQNSCFDYGVPPYIRNEINKPLNEELTYTDLMIALANRHFETLNYLEIGVSVGKNFYQILRAVPQGNFTGFDIEEIHPVLARKLSFEGEEHWQTPQTSIKKNDSSLKRFFYEQNRVEYLCGDVWDENSWKKLAGKQYNLIFSDALHSAKAISFEFEMLVKYNLLADQFMIFWDDLHGKMKRSFLNIVRKYDRQFSIEEVYLIDINGWVGQHEIKHPVGIISNFNLGK